MDRRPSIILAALPAASLGQVVTDANGATGVSATIGSIDGSGGGFGY